MNNNILCPKCGEICDSDVYKTKGKCSECGQSFEISSDNATSENPKNKIASDNANARKKYRQANSINGANTSAKNLKTIATVNEKNATELYNRSQELQKIQTAATDTVPVNLPQRVLNATTQTEQIVDTPSDAAVLPPRKTTTTDSTKIPATVSLPVQSSTSPQIPAQIQHSQENPVFTEEIHPTTQPICQSEEIIPATVHSPSVETKVTSSVENISHQDIQQYTQVLQQEFVSTQVSEQPEHSSITTQSFTYTEGSDSSSFEQNMDNAGISPFAFQNRLNEDNTQSQTNPQNLYANVDDVFAHWNQSTDYEKKQNVINTTENKLTNRFLNRTKKSEKRQDKKECDIDYNFNYDGYYDDTEPLEPAMTDVLTPRTIMKIVGVVVGIIGATVFLIYYA